MLTGESKMLTDKERNEIKLLAENAPDARSACIDALKLVQGNYGFVSDEYLKEIAGLLDMSPDELEGVATFYNLIFRRPVGRHIIRVCDSASCWVMGEESLLQHLEKRLGVNEGETTPDGRFTLLPSPCLGACDKAPVLLIGEKLYGNVTPAVLDEILSEYSET
jgi:NADH-quinone oxidoreductase subunit E